MVPAASSTCRRWTSRSIAWHRVRAHSREARTSTSLDARRTRPRPPSVSSAADRCAGPRRVEARARDRLADAEVRRGEATDGRRLGGQRARARIDRPRGGEPRETDRRPGGHPPGDHGAPREVAKRAAEAEAAFAAARERVGGVERPRRRSSPGFVPTSMRAGRSGPTSRPRSMPRCSSCTRISARTRRVWERPRSVGWRLPGLSREPVRGGARPRQARDRDQALRALPADLDPVTATHAELVVNCDGASRGNPGPAGAGASVAAPDGIVVAEVAEGLGVQTNNVAEYTAVIRGLGGRP